MPKFAYRVIEEVHGKQVFYELCIDGKGQIESFREQLESRYESQLDMIIEYMNRVANLHSLPDTKFREITPSKEKMTEYEFKSKHLRVFAVKIQGGKIIVLCGYKNTQEGDIKKFRGLKKQLIEKLK